MPLDFYAVHDLHPLPEDLPVERISVGAMNIEEYQICADAVHACLGNIGVDASYFSDWIIPAERLGEVLRCLERSGQDLGRGTAALAEFTAIVRRAQGFSLLAVCD